MMDFEKAFVRAIFVGASLALLSMLPMILAAHWWDKR